MTPRAAFAGKRGVGYGRAAAMSDASRRLPPGRLPLSPLNRTGLLGAVMALAYALLAAPPWRAIRNNPDEGQELLKARLVNDGYSLYDQIFADQVPLHTHALAAWMRVFGETLGAARSMTLVLACAAAAALWRLAGLGLGHDATPERRAVAGFLAVGLLLAVGHFAEYATAALIGPPSVYLATIALALADAAARRRSRGADFALAAAAGACLGAALMFKPLTTPYAPVIGAVALFGGIAGRRVTRQSAARAAVLTAVSLLVAGTAAWTLGVFDHLEQAVGVALNASSFGGDTGILIGGSLVSHHLEHLPWLVLAAVGVVAGLRHGWPGTLVAAALALAMEAALLWHWPFWPHSGLAMLLPACWLGGYGLLGLYLLTRAWATRLAGEGRRVAAGRWHAGAAWAVTIVLGTGLLGVRGYFENQGRYDPGLVATLRSRPDRPLYCDRAGYTFLSGRPTPPWLTVTSRKRIATVQAAANDADAWADEVIRHCESAGVDEVVLSRFAPADFGPAFADWLAANFERVSGADGPARYRRVAAPSPPSPTSRRR